MSYPMICCGNPERCTTVRDCTEKQRWTRDALYEANMREKQTELPLEPAKSAAIARPAHYARFAIEPITFIMFNNLPMWAGNVVKYVCRAPYKHETEKADIEKAIRYCQMRLEQLKRARDGTIGDVVGNPL